MDGSVGRSSESKVGLDDEIIIYFGVGERKKKGSVGIWKELDEYAGDSEKGPA